DRGATADDPRDRREPRRERDSLRRARGDVHARRGARRRRGPPARHRRRGRGRRDPALAPLRAVLPRRPGAGVARHGARPGHREARRHAGRRHGGGCGRTRRRTRDPLRIPGAALSVHHSGTTSSPRCFGRGRDTRGGVAVTAPELDNLRLAQLAPAAADDRRGREVVFDVESLDVAYDGSPALRGVTLDIRRNDVTAFIGPSGCGKSTLIRCFNRMNDLIPGAVVSGSVRYHGRDLYAADVDPVEVRRRIGMVFQKPNPFPKSIYDNIAFGPRVLGLKKDLDERIERTLRHAALWDEVKDRLKDNALGLSGGQQQRLCIARALAVE